MAQKSVQLDKETFSCSICVDLLKDPVTIPCGHNYCMNCIENFWDAEDKKKVHSCPQCSQAFTSRPVLVKNTMLAVVVEELKKIGVQAAPVDHSYAKTEDVACDVCTGRKLKALKSCLVCLASYCEKHLQPHYEAAPLKKHKLVEPSKKLQENICSHHDEVMKIFCRTDRQSICYLCSLDEHKGHDTVSAASERVERQKGLDVNHQNIRQRIKDREEDVKVLQQEVEAINRSADKAVMDNDKVFTELISLIENKSSDVRQQIRSKQKTEVSRVKELQEKLKQEIAELKKEDAELERLLYTEDHNEFLHKYHSLAHLDEPTDTSSIDVRPLQYFEDVAVALSETRDKLENILCEQWTTISEAVIDVDVLLTKKTRENFLKYSQAITLDPNTAHESLVLSDGNRVARKGMEGTRWVSKGFYGLNFGRFTGTCQVLSIESLTGRCYWEVELRGCELTVAVAYRTISRAGTVLECEFGNSVDSWAINCAIGIYKFKHNNIETPVSGPWSSRLGVYLDHSAGILSFYSVSETMTLLHRVQTIFTQPLYAGLRFHDSGIAGTTAEFCKLK